MNGWDKDMKRLFGMIVSLIATPFVVAADETPHVGTGLLNVLAESEGMSEAAPEIPAVVVEVPIVAEVVDVEEEPEAGAEAPVESEACVEVGAPKIAWKTPKFSLIARSMSLREGFEAFGAAQGMSVIMTDAVQGVFSGEFKEMPADEFLDRVTTLHHLVWYYDGTALYLCGSGEVRANLLSLRYMKADEVRAMLRQLGIEDARFPIRTTSDDELIMVSGPPRYVALIAETIARADLLREQRTFNEVETRLFPLQYTWADDVTMGVSGPESTAQIRGVATVLNELMQASEGTRMKDVSADAQASKEDDPLKDAMTEAFRPIIRPDNRLNAVIVRDVVTRMPMYERLIQQLDVPQRLIEIGVTVVELSREDALDWQLSLALEGTKSDITGAVGQNPANLTSELVGRGLAGTASYIGNSVTVSGSLSALKEKGKARNISRTSLLTVNNLAARLTDMQSYHARVVGTEVATLEEVTAGTTLEIKPRIIRSSKPETPEHIWMTLELRDGGFETITVDAMPMTRESTLETQASVPVGESILLAGYLRDIKEDAGWGIPYLREIPIIGWLFGGASVRTETVQRLFILTPYIVNAEEADLVRAQATRQRDLSEPMALEQDSDADDVERKEREAQLEEQQEIHEEKANETHLRNNAEREFRRLQRVEQNEADHDRWEEDYNRRREAYGEARKRRSEDVNE